MSDNFELDKWLKTLLDNLKTSFGERLLLVVLVGSRARDDSNPQSDVDVNVILDKVMPEDIILYRDIINSMPNGHYACGYLGGLKEISIWPRYDLVAFHYGCRILHGNVNDVIGPITALDIRDNAMVILSNINHTSRHSLIYDKDFLQSANAMKDLYKATFFVIQCWYFLKYGNYVSRRRELLRRHITAEDRLVLKHYENWDADEQARTDNPLDTIKLLERWSSQMLFRFSIMHIDTASFN
ncbi:MAG: nucleotidyltransferase domain-containing protein [Dehalococcoidales bacterium]|nr:nucleotidyltransferase domain-containing protein [Dehalococcoidales bacterium]